MIPSLLLTLDVAHARFNAVKTFSTLAPSRFENRCFGMLHATRDPARTDAYYNRIVGLTPQSFADVEDAIRWITAELSTDFSVRIELADGSGCQPQLNDLGFRQVEQLLWLQATRPSEHRPGRVRQLSQKDWPALRELLAHHGPISDGIWEHRRDLFCTDSFRWFGIYEGDVLVSASSMWVHGDAAILGSALTLPQHRNQGHHTALLHARRSIPPSQQFVDVEPGSISHHNCLRAGFEPLERRTVWVSRR